MNNPISFTHRRQTSSSAKFATIGRHNMTRKDYRATAEILFSIKHAVTPEIHAYLVAEFSEMFATDNERFDFERFALACK